MTYYRFVITMDVNDKNIMRAILKLDTSIKAYGLSYFPEGAVKYKPYKDDKGKLLNCHEKDES